MNVQLDLISCKRCGNDMPKLRWEKFGYNFCTSCSDVKPKVGRVVVLGQGDHTATEIEIVDQDTAKRLQELENTSRGVKNVPLEVLNYDEDEMVDDAKVITEVTSKAMNDDLEEDAVDYGDSGDDEEIIDEIDISEELEEVM